MRYDKAIGYVKREYRKCMEYSSDSFLEELTGVADILGEMGYGLDYKVTGLFRFLLLDTEARPEDILGHSSMEVLEAVKMLIRPLDCEMFKYIYNIKRNILAHPVILAEHLYNLRNTEKKTVMQIKRIIHESEDYFLKCSQNTMFYEPIFIELLKVKQRFSEG